MKHLLQNLSSRSVRGPILTLVAFWVIYVVVSLFAPTVDAQSRYGLTAVQANLLKITVWLPYLFIWVCGLLAVLSFHHYASLIPSSPEGRGYRRIYRGLIFLFLVVLVPILISLIRAFQPDNDSVVKMVTIVNNYLVIIFYLGAFWYLLRGSRDLNKTLQVTKGGNGSSTIVITLIALLSIIYIWAVFHNPVRTSSTDALVPPTYYLSDPLILLTIILPYILIWIWGALAINNIVAYAQNVTGQIYREAFLSIARGLTAIIGLSILVQFLPAAGRYFARADLGIILLIIYLLLIVIAVGYILVARGASKLAIIEKI